MDIAQHYARSAGAYAAAPFYDEESSYHDWVVATVGHSLELDNKASPPAEPDSPRAPAELGPKSPALTATTRLVDLGAGTGVFSAALAKQHPGLSVLAVEPSHAMLQQGASAGVLEHISTRCTDAATFTAERDVRYDRCLLKEVVHHLTDPAAVFAGIRRQLTVGGVCVVVTRPQDVAYPFFARAREVWAANQPPVHTFTDAMAAAGFEGVAARRATNLVTMPLAQWVAMVRARVWSTFSHFDDAALEAGVAEIEAAWGGSADGSVSFQECLLIVTGRAPPCLQD